ncbi:eukaryotic translation initiation factor 5B isoform X2 [Venturia canescens]|uniref:eukaryotic translation initiation factor 5B isoform X2 n=1 Tax=Venturia canescens TaxID=32260 RepID=UPI001C9CF1D6|nr:eukaryotic translation initiation factor 5B isoform X2 [Venturia canescens]
MSTFTMLTSELSFDFSESDIDVEEQSTIESTKSKMKDKKKNKKGDDVDDLADELQELKVEKNKAGKKKSKRGGQADSDDDSVSLRSKTKGKKNLEDDESDAESENERSKAKSKGKKNQGKKGFAALDLGSEGSGSDERSEEKVPKNQKKNKKKNRKTADSEDDSEGEAPRPKGQKSQKGQKNRAASDDDDDFVAKSKGIKNSKGKKGRKNVSDDDDDESEDEQPQRGKGKGKKGRKASESEEDMSSVSKIKVSKKNAPKAAPARGGFALLEIDDDNDDEPEEQPMSEDESEKAVSVERIKGSKPQEPQGKKGKKGKKKRNDSEEDIEKVLAELEMEYSGKKVESKAAAPIEPEEEKSEEKSNKKKEIETNDKNEEEVDQDGRTVKTAAQKKKEKKEREKQKKLAQKKAETGKKPESNDTTKGDSTEIKIDKVEQPVVKAQESVEGEVDGEAGEDTKKKKKKGAAKEEPKEKMKGPGRKIVAAMQEALKKAKEDEERLRREEEERIALEEAREKARLEQLQLEQERKEKKKLKEKQRKERLKAEGKLLTTKQKQDRARAQAMLEALKAQGLDLPAPGEKKKGRPSLGTRIRPNKMKQRPSIEEKDDKKSNDEEKTDCVQVEIVDQQPTAEQEPKKEEEVKDSWDVDTSEGEPEEEKSDERPKGSEMKVEKEGSKKKRNNEEKADEKKECSESDSESGTGDSDSEEGSEDDEDEDEEDDDEEEEEEEESSPEDKMTDAERKKEKARQRIMNRRIEAEKNRTLDVLRAAVVCVLGHVDTGKTKILDKLRRTNVQDGEAGGITQQIGATNVPIEAIQDSARHVRGFAEKEFRIPGLLIIDTPGHESFSNLRNRGSSLCDIAILVVDIMHGLEPQTIESINLLKAKKCPFVVALNKIDRLYDWQTMNRKDVQDIIKAQAINTQREFEKRSKDTIVQFAEQGLNAALFYENPDPRSYVSLVPTSAITGEGMGNLLALIVDACQGPLAKRLMFSEELQATVLEVKALPGLGTTIDCILVNGTLREGDTMIVAGTDGPIVTQIRSLLVPQPLKELRVKSAYIEHRQLRAAQGVKIAAKDLEKAIAGLNLQVAQKPDEVEVLKEETAKELSKALGNIKLAERGVFVQASTLGALEALLDFLKSNKIPYAGIRIGPVVKKDVMKASIMLEHDSQYATILAFDVKVERDAQELADSLGVKIFVADIIYHLFDKFTGFREELKQRKRDEHRHIAVFPCKLRVLPQHIFNSRDPIVMGVMVEAGIVRDGTPVCVPSKEFVDLGIVTSIEYNHKTVDSARKGQEVCVKIEPVPGEAPKMYGRHFDEKDFIVSKISRQSIDACKDYFRDDLLKTDWQLMVELKKLFEIL